MDAADLRFFEAVARSGSMSRAATTLNTVQSNVTARIRQLEDEMGVRLFARARSGVTLTAAGRRLLPYAERVRVLLGEARRAATDDGEPRGTLVIGALESTAALRIAPLIAPFVASCPEVDLVLRTGTSAELIGAVLDDRIEGAFVCGPLAHPDLAAEIAFHEELVLATPIAFRDIRDLDGAPGLKAIVLRAGCSYRQRLESLLAARGVVGARLLEFGTIEAIVATVGAGLGVTLLPRAILAPAAAAGRVAIHALPAGAGRVETLFVRRRGAHLSSALAAFLERTRPALTLIAAE